MTPRVSDADGLGPTASLSLKTIEAAPSRSVTELKVLDFAHNEVAISWKPSPEPNGIIMSYAISLNNESILNFNPDGWSSKIELNGLSLYIYL